MADDSEQRAAKASLLAREGRCYCRTCVETQATKGRLECLRERVRHASHLLHGQTPPGQPPPDLGHLAPRLWLVLDDLRRQHATLEAQIRRDETLAFLSREELR